MEYRLKSFLVIVTLATLAQYSAQDTPNATDNLPSSTKNRVSVEVFYEGDSEESKKFINDQLIPTNKELNAYIDIKLMPFAMGSVTPKANDNSTDYTVSCGGGNSICTEDKIHACALKNIENDMNKTLEFINCTMSQKDDAKDVQKCGNDIKLNQTVIDKIAGCLKDNKEVITLLQADQTAHEIAKVTAVPTVLIAKNSTVESLNLAKTDLKKAVCQSIPDPKPSQCSGADAIIAGMLPLLIGAYFFIKSF